VSFVVTLVARGLERQHLEPTLLSYISSTIAVLLNIVLVVAILGYFGVDCRDSTTL
jgi:small conductance mechanosensitive channel